MRRQSILITTILFITLLFTIRPSARSTPAGSGSQGKQLLSSDQIKVLFLLMDADKDGKISKQEWMSFMAAEFDKLDQRRSGKLDAGELSQLTLPAMTFASTGK